MGNANRVERSGSPRQFACDKCGQRFPDIIRKIVHESDCEGRPGLRAVGALMALHEDLERRRKLEELKQALVAFNITMEMLKDDDDDSEDESGDDSRKSLLGCRVVRSGSWKWQNQDGGEGNVGTVIKVEKAWLNIVWDSGPNNSYRAGMGDCYDLLVLDSRQAGVKHPNVQCDGCEVRDDCLRGTRWKCHDCEDFDLCTPCFMANKHDMKHRFIRFETTKSSGLLLPSRDKASARIQSKGLFVGATVQRGLHWGWRDQDGGAGKQGRITKIKGFRDEHAHDAASVQWNAGNENTYMVGCNHEVDLKCVTPANGPAYYKDYLWPCGSKPVFTKEKPFKVGDKVEIAFHPLTMKQMQKGHGGWAHHMVILMNKHGVVHSLDSDNDVRVKYDREDLGVTLEDNDCVWIFNPATLKKVSHAPAATTSRPSQARSGPPVLPKPQAYQRPPPPPAGRATSSSTTGSSSQATSTRPGQVSATPSTSSTKPAAALKKVVQSGASAGPSSSKAGSSTGSGTHDFKVGDMVKVSLPADILKDFMVAHTDCWSDEMEQVTDKLGTICSIKPDNLVSVRYQVDPNSGIRLKNQIFIYHREILELVEDQGGMKTKSAIESNNTSGDGKEGGSLEPKPCLICEETIAVIMFKPCGHKILCQGCGTNTPMKRCLSCQTLITKKVMPFEDENEMLKNKLEEMRESQMCAICFDNDRNFAFNPCGHGACGDCTPSLEKCHICRQDIQSTLKLF
uniref:Zinc finger protein ZF(ZZ/RING)-1 n=1 Tax=Phallusia mammillata TaxID=59560 RepID=A0A6F9DLG4_9ASCI|nr:zinc finger protein ZF(ZZ/RING)-1 [Phallusia mammillata]